MVDALDFTPTVKVEVISGKTHRLTCDGCDWMETAGSTSTATRKKNAHLAEHRSATHGLPEVPTIFDAIEGVDHVPEVKNAPVPVGDVEYLRSLRDSAEAVVAALEVPVADLGPEPCAWCAQVHEGGPEECNDVGQRDAREAEASVPAFLDPTPEERGTDSEGTYPPRGMPLPATRYELTTARLELQKGASDHNRDEWLAQRAQSVSATLVAKLGQAIDLDYVIAEQVTEKIHGSSFTGNSFTAWGKEREPYLEQVGLARHGIVGESHLFFARGNRRHSASPDGIAIHPETGEVALGEYKTSGKELTWPKVVSNGYFDQVQWQLHVLEASHCWLLWEWRLEENGVFYPKPGGEHLIMRDDARIAELVRRADLFLAALDDERDRMTTMMGRPPGPVVDPVLKGLVSAHLEAKGAALRAEEELRYYCETNGVKSVEIDGLAKVSYVWGSPRSTFDREAFDAEHPGLYESYLKEGRPPERPTLRVKAKGEDET